MTTSNYFDNYNDNVEQDLLEDLIQETIHLRGIDVLYIPRTLVNADTLYGEDTISAFNSAHRIEMLITTVDAFEGDGDFFGKFGFQINDSATIVCSQKRFGESISGMIKSIQSPRPGDLIYIPFMKNLFEIIGAKNDQPFYQLGKNHTFEMRIEMYEFSHETFSTGIADVDNYARNLANANSVVNDPHADNVAIETEADGSALDGFDDTGTDDRGTGTINFTETDIFGGF